MRAIVFDRYGPPEVLQLRQRETPKPGPGELLIRVRATSVTPSDILMRSGKFPALFWLPVRFMYGFFRPRRLIPGYELSGEVVGLGPGVEHFRVGDQVFGATMWKMSCAAEYICLPQTAPLVQRPETVRPTEAVALVDGACTALFFLQKIGLARGQKIAIYGASGSVGTAAVQLAKHMGADVTAICSAKNHDLVGSLGASRAIDYREQNFSLGQNKYDVVFDTVGRCPIRRGLQALQPGGVFTSTRVGVGLFVAGTLLTIGRNRRFTGGFTTTSRERLEYIKKLVAQGAFRAVIDRTLPLHDIAKAHRYVAKGHKRGNVVITV